MADLEALKELYPDLSQAGLLIAKETLDRYLSLAWEIMEDHRAAQVMPSFPEASSRGTMQERSIPT